MPAVQIRDLPQSTYELLKAEAQTNGRSINKQTETILVSYFAQKNAPAAAPSTSQSPCFSTQHTNTFPVESAEAVAQRAKARGALFARIDQTEPFIPTGGWNAAEIVREMRDER